MTYRAGPRGRPVRERSYLALALALALLTMSASPVHQPPGTVLISSATISTRWM